jgi:hypothetical protein
VSEAPPTVVALAEQRATARQARDFVEADRLRDAIGAAGWTVTDTPDGFELAARPPFDVSPTLGALPGRRRGTEPRVGATGLLLVSGWPDDVTRFGRAWLEHAPAELGLVGLDLGDVAGAGRALHELGRENPDRVVEWHVATTERQAGWGAAMNALADRAHAEVLVVADPSSVLDGDAVSPLLDALQAPGVVAAGWRGVNVDTDDEWRSFAAAGPGEVDAVLGYLFAVRHDAFAAVGGFAPKARFYRNADLELSLSLRAAGGRIVVPSAELPVHQERHRGYHDSDPQVRERESRKTYDRILRQFRGRDELLAPRP